MVNIAITKDAESNKSLPIFREIAQRMDEVKRRAFERFARRGFEPGLELDDWFTAEHDVFGWASAELKEVNSRYEMEVTVPGFGPKEIEVTASPDELIVHAASVKRNAGEDEKVLWSEFGSNEVCRRFVLPAAIDVDAVTAELSNGVLKVHAPKSKAAKETSKTIPVRAS